MKIHLTTTLSAAVIAIVSCIVFLNSLGGGFVWDDHFVIVDNIALRDARNIPGFFTADIWKASNNPPSPYYRPIINTIWALEYQLWGEKPMGYHAFNLVAHAALSVLLYFLFLNLINSKNAAMLAALIFAVHPAHSENVAWIGGGGYIVCSLFLVSAFILYLRYSNSPSQLPLAASTFLFTGGVLTHESALMFPFVLFLYEYLSKDRWMSIKSMLPYLIVVVLFLVLRSWIIAPSPESDVSMVNRLLTFPVILTNYLQAFFFPPSLKVFYELQPATTLLDVKVSLSLVVLAFILLGAVVLHKKKKIALFALLWFMIFFIPFANIVVVLQPQMMASRYLYIPSIGLCLLIGLTIERANPRLLLAGIPLIALLSLWTYVQNQYWLTDIALNEKMVADAPSSVVARNNLGVSYLNARRYTEALPHFQKALELDPINSFASYNLGNVYQKLNRLDESLRYLKMAITLNPSYSRAYNSLGMTYQKKGLHEEAIGMYSKALHLDPSNYLTHYNLASILVMRKRDREATEHYVQFLRLAPATYESWKESVRRLLRNKGIATRD